MNDTVPLLDGVASRQQVLEIVVPDLLEGTVLALLDGPVPVSVEVEKTMRSSSTPSVLSSSAMHCMRQDLPQRRTPVMTLIVPSSW